MYQSWYAPTGAREIVVDMPRIENFLAVGKKCQHAKRPIREPLLLAQEELAWHITCYPHQTALKTSLLCSIPCQNGLGGGRRGGDPSSSVSRHQSREEERAFPSPPTEEGRGMRSKPSIGIGYGREGGRRLTWHLSAKKIVESIFSGVYDGCVDVVVYATTATKSTPIAQTQYSVFSTRAWSMVIAQSGSRI